MRAPSGGLALARGDFFQNSASDFLEFPETRQVILEFVIEELRVLRAKLGAQNHVPQFYGMRKQRLFLQFRERNFGIVVIHGFPQQKTHPLYCTQLWLRVGTYPKNREILRGVCRGRHEFIARDFCGDAHSAVFGGLDAHNLSQTADIYVARLRDLLRKSNDEFNLVANFEIGISKEVQPAVTDIPRVSVQFAAFGFARQNAQRKIHRESPRFAAFRSITHQYPLGMLDWAQN